MKQQFTAAEPKASSTWERLEDFVRQAVAHDGGQALQEGRACHGTDLENLAGGRVHISATQGSRVAAGRACRCAVSRRRAAENEHVTEDCRLSVRAQAFPCPGAPEGVKKPYALPKLGARE
jgi:hypothetical protein